MLCYIDISLSDTSWFYAVSFNYYKKYLVINPYF